MKLKTLTLTLALTFSTTSFADVSKETYCEHVYQYAKQAMVYRQSVTPARKVQEEMFIYSEYHAGLLNDAYQAPVRNNDKQQQVIINDYSRSNEMECKSKWQVIKAMFADSKHVKHFKENNLGD